MTATATRARRALEHGLAELRRRHRVLDDEIAEMSRHVSVDDLELQELKRRKLALKDAIAALERQANGGDR